LNVVEVKIRRENENEKKVHVKDGHEEEEDTMVEAQANELNATLEVENITMETIEEREEGPKKNLVLFENLFVYECREVDNNIKDAREDKEGHYDEVPSSYKVGEKKRGKMIISNDI
jgi:hypothetical protein